MSYHLVKYFAVFLPLVIIIYQLVPKKFRFIVTLAADYFFFFMCSKWLVVYLMISTLITHFVGLWLEWADTTALKDSKLQTRRKRRILATGILSNLGVLVVLKYFNFLGSNIVGFINLFGADITYSAVDFLIPIGISYYTLEIIGYLTDVYRNTQKAEHNLAKTALFLSFFPQIMEGPICRFHQTADKLFEGEGIHYVNLKSGYQRILWGLAKKIVIADRLAPAVSEIFKSYSQMGGFYVIIGAVLYTCQLYMEFSGCMDIIIGTGEIFGINLPENFRQPFLAKNASEFWRRWHITLGTWFKDYIFYTVSLAKPVKNFAKKVKNRFGRNVSKFVAPTVALFCVWSCNGLWHGAKWTYIFYGMYYFVLIFIENITEEPVKKLTAKLKINRESKAYRVFQAVKLFLIVIVGELFFRADTVKDGFLMIGRVFTDFGLRTIVEDYSMLGLDTFDWIIVIAGVVGVSFVGILHEKGISVREKIASWSTPVRWVFWYAGIMAVVFLGAYGFGYTAVDLIYAGY